MNSIRSKEAGKSLGPRLAIVVLVAALLLSIVAVSIPNLLRSRYRSPASDPQRMDNPVPASTELDSLNKTVAYKAAGSRQANAQPGDGFELRKVIRTGFLDMVVGSPAESMEAVRAIASKHGGWVDSAQMSQSRNGLPYAAITVRVPQTRFDDVRREIRTLSEQVQNDRTETQDVTGQYVDLEASIKNYRAEEAQYQEIMRRTGSIKDTLQVAERLADVRGRIERAQAQLNVLARQVAMATLTVHLHVEPIPVAQDVIWHPVAKFKAAFADAKLDLIDYGDFIIVVLVNTPVVLVWLLTFLFGVAMAWKLLRYAFRKLFPRRATAAQPASA
ncbi:MAG: DUF4349 domain-containing protein [Acidobacteria bacterium]|nr:DUF4349 domain-containing protein [Acidobacteriota bacterium]